jgi:hypothetical protein
MGDGGCGHWKLREVSMPSDARGTHNGWCEASEDGLNQSMQTYKGIAECLQCNALLRVMSFTKSRL